jgi:hypothetical protein
MFIATSNLKPRSVRSEMYLATNHQQQNNIALRWIARFEELLSYKHLAPTGQSTQNDYCCTSKLNLQLIIGH